MSNVVSKEVSGGQTNCQFNDSSSYVGLHDRVDNFVSYVGSGSYTIYSAIKKLSSLEYEIRLMLDYYENNKSEIISEVVDIKNSLEQLMSICKDRVINNIVSEVIDNIEEWIVLNNLESVHNPSSELVS